MRILVILTVSILTFTTALSDNELAYQQLHVLAQQVTDQCDEPTQRWFFECYCPAVIAISKPLIDGQRLKREHPTLGTIIPPSGDPTAVWTQVIKAYHRLPQPQRTSLNKIAGGTYALLSLAALRTVCDVTVPEAPSETRERLETLGRNAVTSTTLAAENQPYAQMGALFQAGLQSADREMKQMQQQSAEVARLHAMLRQERGKLDDYVARMQREKSRAQQQASAYRQESQEGCVVQ